MQNQNTRRGNTHSVENQNSHSKFNLESHRFLLSKVKFRIKYGMTDLFDNGGFTLIELLVVVLIIGILAAVALPQYQVAVEKAKVARVLPLLRSLSDARTLYYLANGELPCHIEDLDISFPYESKTEMGGRYSCTEADYRYNFSEGGFIALGSKDDLIFYSSQKDDYHIDVYREPRTWGTKTGNIVCVANLRVGTLGEKLCKSLGTYAYSNEVQQDFYVANF